MSIETSFEYKTIPTQQVKNCFEVFTNFFKNENIENVIEIGTSYGGLSLFLYEQSLINNFEFKTFDISDQRLLKSWYGKEIPFNYFIGDCFDTLISDEIKNILDTKKTLLLCDGGDKKKEFNLFSRYIKDGSFIMAHDYSPDYNYFNENIKNKYWNWCEIRDENIEESFEYVKKSNYYDTFLSISWLHCSKK